MLDRVLDALIGVLPPDQHDAEFLADVLWLAAARTPAASSDETQQADPAADPDPSTETSEQPGQQRESRRRRISADFPLDDPWSTRPGSADSGSYGVYEEWEAAEHDGALAVAAGRALPQSVELARSLRPFMRRFPHGRRSGLDIAATVDSFSRGGELLPVIGPLPEPWFEVLVVVDAHLSMEVWHDAVEEFTALLANSGAFRQVHRWRLSTEPHPYVTDARGRLVRSRNVPAPDGRRIVLVVSDCLAPAWYGNEVWQMLRSWAGQASLSVANPLPPRLWHRTALDLPAVRVRNRLPGERNTALTVSVPPHLRSVVTDLTGCVAVPTLTLTAHSLSRWARGLVRGAPEGYEAVLVTPFGAPESFTEPMPPGWADEDYGQGHGEEYGGGYGGEFGGEFGAQFAAEGGGEAGEEAGAGYGNDLPYGGSSYGGRPYDGGPYDGGPYDGGPYDDGWCADDRAPAARGPLADDEPPWSPGGGGAQSAAGPARAFLRTASRAAVRLAAICSPFQRMSLPLVQLIRQEAVPEATTSDVAELLMSGMLRIRTGYDGGQVVAFRDGAREPLAAVAGRHDAWHVLDVLSRYIAQRHRLPGSGVNAFAALDTDELPPSLRPFAYATADVVAALRAGAEPLRPPALGSAGSDSGAGDGGSGFGEGGFGDGAFGGDPAEADPAADPAMPDPSASAALLIGVVPEGDEAARRELESRQRRLAALLLSEWSWHLPPRHCVWVMNPSPDDLRLVVDQLTDVAHDALLLHVMTAATPAPRGEGTGGAAAGDADAVENGADEGGPEVVVPAVDSPLSGLSVEQLGTVDHLVVIQDRCAPQRDPQAAPDLRSAGRLSTTWITADYQLPDDGRMVLPSFTDRLLRIASAGVPSAPRLLTLAMLEPAELEGEYGADIRPRLPGGFRGSALHDDRAPAFVRNRAPVEPRAFGNVSGSVERVLDRVRDDVGLDAWPDEAADAAERILSAFLLVAAMWLRDPKAAALTPPDYAGSPLEYRLTGTLARSEVTFQEGRDFSLHCRAAGADREAVVPVQVVDFSDGLLWHGQPPDTDPWILPAWQADERTPPFALMLVLGGRQGRERKTLAQQVTVHRDAALGSSVVTLRLPVEAELLDAAGRRGAGRRGRGPAEGAPAEGPPADAAPAEGPPAEVVIPAQPSRPDRQGEEAAGDLAGNASAWAGGSPWAGAVPWPGAVPEPRRGSDGDDDESPEAAALRAVEAYCAYVNAQAVETALPLAGLSMSVTRYAPSGMEDAVVVMVRPAPETLRRIPPQETGRPRDPGRDEVHVQMTVGLVGMLPTFRLERTPNVVVLAEEGHFAFVSVELTLRFVFTWRPDLPAALELRRVTSTPDGDPSPGG